MRIELAEDDKDNTCVITVTLDTTEVDRNKVRHSFPMPKLLVTTRFVKLPVRDFCETSFIVTAQSLKGRIKENSIITSHPDEHMNTIVEVNPLHQIE